MPWQRKRQPWWLTIFGLVLSVGLLFASIPEANYVSGQLSSDTAAHLVIIALTICILASIAYFWPGIPGWQAGAAIGYFGGFSFMVSLVEGWDSQIQASIFMLRVVQIVGTVGLIAWSIWWARRFNSRVGAVMREAGEDIQKDTLFTDDGVRIQVYPDRLRLLIQAGIQIAFTVVVFLGLRWLSSTTPTSRTGLGILGLLVLLAIGALISALSVIRLVMHSPTLEIGPDGILDNASMTITGRGLLRWDEILAVDQYNDKKQLGITYHYLYIAIADYDSVRNRQPQWKRLLAYVVGGRWPSSVAIIRALLDRSPAQLAEEITAYAVQHAPQGWRSPLTVGAHKTKRHRQPSHAD